MPKIHKTRNSPSINLKYVTTNGSNVCSMYFITIKHGEINLQNVILFAENIEGKMMIVITVVKRSNYNTECRKCFRVLLIFNVIYFVCMCVCMWAHKCHGADVEVR